MRASRRLSPRFFSATGRPTDHPLIVHLADAARLDAWARDVPETALRLAEDFSPVPLPLVLTRLAGVLDAETGGLDTVALRMPSHPVALALLAAFGDGIRTITSDWHVCSPWCKPSHYPPGARVIPVAWDNVQQQVAAWYRRGQLVGVLDARRPTAMPENGGRLARCIVARARPTTWACRC